MTPDNRISPVTPEILRGHRIGIFEDNQLYFESIRALLEFDGITLSRIAKNMPEAIKAIPKLAEEGYGIVLVDGNLTPGDRSGLDGRIIIAEIKKLGLPIITVGHSFEGDVEGADYQMSKESGTEKLEELLTNSLKSA